MARITFSLPDNLEPVIDDRVREEKIPSVSAYICDLVTRDLTAAGLLKDDPIKVLRAKVAAVAIVAGHDQTNAALDDLLARSYEAAAAAVTQT